MENRPNRIGAGIAAALLATMLAPGGTADARTQVLISPRKPSAAQDAIVRRAFGTRYAGIVPYNFGRADLNGDGRPDLVVWPQNSRYCGTTGCMLLAIPTTTRGYGAPVPMTYSQGAMLTVLDAMHHGMHDISLVGRLAGSQDVFAWDGSHYAKQGGADDGTLAFNCDGPQAAKGRKVVAENDLPVGRRPGACFAVAPIYNLGAGEIIATEPSPRCPGARAIDVYTRAIAGGYYALFDAPICGASIRLGPPQDGRRIATVLIDGRRYGDVAGMFRLLP